MPAKSATIRLVHLSGPRRGQTDEVGALPASIGSDRDAQVVVPGTAPRHSLLLERSGEVLLQDGGSGQGTWLLGESIREAIVRNGDVIELGPGGPKLRYRHEGEERVGLLKAIAWARPEGAPQSLADTTGFFGTVVKETVVRTSRLFRISLAVVALLGAAALIYSQWQSRRLGEDVKRLREAVAAATEEQRRFLQRVESERSRSNDERKRLEAQILEARAREEELVRRLREAQSTEAQAVREERKPARERLATLEGERAAAEEKQRQLQSLVEDLKRARETQPSAEELLRLRNLQGQLDSLTEALRHTEKREVENQQRSQGGIAVVLGSVVVAVVGVGLILLWGRPSEKHNKPATSRPVESPAPARSFEYDVALSYAGEDRPHATKLAQLLRKNGVRVFFDAYETHRIWGRDLSKYLHEIYSAKARYCVLFVSKHYAGKVWTEHELRAVLERVVKERGAPYVLQIKIDETVLPGLSENIAFLPLGLGAQQIFEYVKQKLQDEGQP